MMISPAAKCGLCADEGMMETLAIRGKVVPLGAGGMFWAVRVDLFSFRVKRILSSAKCVILHKRR